MGKRNDVAENPGAAVFLSDDVASIKCAPLLSFFKHFFYPLDAHALYTIRSTSVYTLTRLFSSARLLFLSFRT